MPSPIFPPREQQLTMQAAWAYAQATNDENYRYRLGELAPPMFAVVLEMPLLMDAMKSPEVLGDPSRFLRLLHGEQRMRFLAPLVPGETYVTRGEVTSRTDKGSGELIDITLTTDRAGRAIVVSQSGLFIRHPEGQATRHAPEPAKAKVEREIILVSEETVALDQTRRYAEASGDHNPIHLDDTVAKKAGLPGVILHGLCTMALAQKHLINGISGGDPTTLRALSLRFSKPVFPGQTLIVSAWQDSPGHYGFEVSAAGKLVAKDGHAEFGKAS